MPITVRDDKIINISISSFLYLIVLLDLPVTIPVGPIPAGRTPLTPVQPLTGYTMSIRTVVENPITPDKFYQGQSLTFEVHFNDTMNNIFC